MSQNILETAYIDYDNLNEYDDVGVRVANERLRRTQPLDLDFTLNKNPTSSDLSVKRGSNSIKQSIRSLLLTDYYERLFRPELGSNIRRLLFEPVDFISERILEESITNVINNFESRVTLLSVNVSANPDEYRYDVRIVFSINRTNEQQIIDTFLETTRG